MERKNRRWFTKPVGILLLCRLLKVVVVDDDDDDWLHFVVYGALSTATSVGLNVKISEKKERQAADVQHTTRPSTT